MVLVGTALVCTLFAQRPFRELPAWEYNNFPLGLIFDKGLRIQQGQSLPHVYMDPLLALIREGKLRADDIITHRVGLDEVPKAIETFNDKEDGCVKVVIRP